MPPVPIRIDIGRRMSPPGQTPTATPSAANATPKGPPKPIRVLSDWNMEQISLSVENLDTGEYSTVTVDAEVHSVFAINESFTRRLKQGIQVPKGWTLTHIPTGLDVALMNDKEDCRKMAMVLLHHCKKAFYSSSMKETRLLVPQTVIYWIVDCKKARKFLDPVGMIMGYVP